MIRVGIIGCGKIAQVRHAPEYAQNPACRLLSFYDMRRDTAMAMAAQYGGTAYDSVEALLNSGVDAVSVCVANDAHADICIQALESGIHVLCEKPMATTLEGCERMVETAARRGRRLVIGHNQRLMPTHQKARELIRAGKIGRPLAFHTAFAHAGPELWTGDRNTWFFRKDSAAFGAIGDLGIHKIDLMHFLLGEPIVRVFSRLATVHKKDPQGQPIGVDDNALCTFETAGGILGQMHASWTNYGTEDHGTIVYGEAGVLRCYREESRPLVVQLRGGEEETYALDAVISNEEQIAGRAENTGVVDAFLQSVQGGEASFCEGAEALWAMRVVFAAQQSSLLRREIEIRQ